MELCLQLCELVSQTAIGELLGSVDEDDCEEFYQYYLHDFIRSVHRCYHKQQKSKHLEYKVHRSYWIQGNGINLSDAIQSVHLLSVVKN